MRRVVSLWFPHWPTDRLRRQQGQNQGQAASPEVPLVTALHDGRRRVIAAVDQLAASLGLRPGMAIAQALALVPDLQIAEAEPEADAMALSRLARWCHRTTPLASADTPDGLWLDIDGCAHLWGGEAALLQALIDRLGRDGLHARGAVADTPGAAHALARFGGGCTIVPAGQQGAAAAALPVACLRLAPELSATLRRLGFEHVGHLTRIPRSLLTRRFGPLPGLRLDQVHGRVHETLQPLQPDHVLQCRIVFLEPLLTAEALAVATAHLTAPLCEEMESTGLGARQLDLMFERVDGQVAAIRVGTVRPSRDARHLTGLLNERLETIDPGLGVEAMRLVVSLAEPLQWEQQDGGRTQTIAPLVDRLTNRLGKERLYRASPFESKIPERSVCHDAPYVRTPTAGLMRDEACVLAADASGSVSPLSSASPVLTLVVSQEVQSTGLSETESAPSHLRLVETASVPVDEPALPDPPILDWKRPWAFRHKQADTDQLGVPWPGRLQAPSRLLNPPRRVDAIAALPNQPPVSFTWRRHRHRVHRADGPDRVYGEWWRQEKERQSVRDYFEVEDESGQRFWLFREGNGQDSGTGDLSWYLHGLF